MRPLLAVILCLGAGQTQINRKEPLSFGCSKSGDCAEQDTCINGGCVDVCSVAGCDAGTVCKAYQHRAICVSTSTTPLLPFTKCSLECAGDDQCPPDRSCIDHRCVDPCPARCGTNSTCRVVNHVPSCACLPGHSGDPFQACGYNPGGECNWAPGSTGVKKYRAETSTEMDWFRAVLQCLWDGQRLATIRNEEEAKAIMEVLRDAEVRTGRFWIGGVDELHNTEWFWFPTYERIGPFMGWSKEQPDLPGKEDCIELVRFSEDDDYKWNNYLCDRQLYYICEYYEYKK